MKNWRNFWPAGLASSILVVAAVTAGLTPAADSSATQGPVRA